MTVPKWICPECHRGFGRVRQSHECSPAMTLDEYFSTGPERERPIFEAVRDVLQAVGPIHVEPVSVGIFIKSTRGFIELRPKTKWVALSFALPREITHPKIARKMRSSARVFHVVNLHTPDDLDDDVRDWIVESYLAATD